MRLQGVGDSWSKALAAFGERWPEWRVRLVPLHVRELFNWKERLIYIDAECADPVWQLKHSEAHLDYHRQGVKLGEWFSDRQEGEANLVAALDLGRFDWTSEAGAMEDNGSVRRKVGET